MSNQVFETKQDHFADHPIETPSGSRFTQRRCWWFFAYPSGGWYSDSDL